MRKKEERVHESCLSDRSHVMLPNISSFRACQKMIQEQMMHENKFHDKHFPALVTSTRASKLSKVVDSGCLFFGDHDFADDDAADDEDVATADDDDDETHFH